MKVNDGMGNVIRATVIVNPIKSEPKNDGEISGNRQNEVARKKYTLLGEASAGVKLFFGLSIMLNLFLGMYVRKRKKIKGKQHQEMIHRENF